MLVVYWVPHVFPLFVTPECMAGWLLLHSLKRSRAYRRVPATSSPPAVASFVNDCSHGAAPRSSSCNISSNKAVSRSSRGPFSSFSLFFLPPLSRDRWKAEEKTSGYRDEKHATVKGELMESHVRCAKDRSEIFRWKKNWGKYMVGKKVTSDSQMMTACKNYGLKHNKDNERILL